MEAEVVHDDCTVTSSTIAATALGTENFVTTSKPRSYTPAEISPGTDSQPPVPSIQHSTDLRKKLPLDVLASLLCRSSNGDSKYLKESVIDSTSNHADVECISDFSSLSPPLEHDNSSATETLLPSSAAPIVESSHGSDDADAPPTSVVSLPRSSSLSRHSEYLPSFSIDSFTGNGALLLLPGPLTADSLPSASVDEALPDAFAASLTSSASSIANTVSAVAAVVVDDAYPASSSPTIASCTHTTSTVVSSTRDSSHVLSSSTFISSTNDSSRLSNATTALPSSRLPLDLSEATMAGPPVSDAALAALEASDVPLVPVSSRLRFLVRDEVLATFESSHQSLQPISSFVLSPVRGAAIPVPSSLESASYSLTVRPPHPNTDIAAWESLPVAHKVSLSAVDRVPVDSTRAPVQVSLVEVQHSPSGDNALAEATWTSPEAHPLLFEPLLSAPADPLSDAPAVGLEDSVLVGECHPSAFADLPSAGTSASLTPSPVPHMSLAFVSVSVSYPSASSAVPLDLPCPFNNTVILDTSRTVITPPLSPSRPSAGEIPLTSGAASASFASSLTLPEVLPNDSLPSPPHAARLWDVPSSSLPSGISLSVYFNGSRSPFRGRKSARKRKAAEAGADLEDTKGKGLIDAEKLEEVAELESMLEAQKKIVRWQIDEIQRIGALQCQLTCSNPLSKEVVWEVLGVKGGGVRSGDSLSPEALRCLQEIFAVKDTLTKKEARDISFTLGASLTQVREFFAAQRFLVRKLVQQAHDDAGRLNIRNASEQTQQVAVLNTISEVEKDLGIDKLSGAESVEKLLEAMRAEKGFAGRVQLSQVILHTDSAALILRRFLEKGGLKMLSGWLVEAAAEQQTSVICYLLKVLDHLPMSNAISHQMPPLVQNVNRLRFHHVSAVVGQARSLFTKWCKMFSPKAEGLKAIISPGSKFLPGSAVPSGGSKRNLSRALYTSLSVSNTIVSLWIHIKVDASPEIDDPPAEQSAPGSRRKKVKAEEIFQLEIKASPTAAPGSSNVNGMTQGISEYPSSSQVSVSPKPRWSSTLQPSESAVAAVSVSRKHLAPKSLSNQSKDRRKMQLVEDKYLGKSAGLKPTTTSKNSRPLSTDDIYRAKKLERLMQEPVGKTRRRLVASQEQFDAKSASILTSISKKCSSPAVPEHLGAEKKMFTSTPNPCQRSFRGALTETSSQEEQEPVQRTSMLGRSVEHDKNKITITPTSSLELFQMTNTPTSSQELSLPGMVSHDVSEDMVRKSGSVLIGRISDSSRGLPVTMYDEGVSQTLTESAGSGVDLKVSECFMSDGASHPIHSLQEISEYKSPVFEEEIMTSLVESKSAAVKDVCLPTASCEPSDAKLEELSGLSVCGGMINCVSRPSLDVTGFKDEMSLGHEPGAGNDIIRPSPLDMTLSDFYAALRASMVRWNIPPEYQPDEQWNVATGEDSKEKDVQSGRVKREEEVYYADLSAIPDDPKDPWEEEPNYDDSLTSEICVEIGLQKDLSAVISQSHLSKHSIMNVVQYSVDASLGSAISSNAEQNATINHGQELSADLLSKVPKVNGLDLVFQQESIGGGGGTHDPDLLALLLRNPELVSQLTSGQAFSHSGIADPGVFMQPLDPLKQSSSGGNNGAVLSFPAGDLGQEMLIPSSNSKAVGIPLQPGRSLPFLDQLPSDTMRVQDSVTMMPHHGTGQQQTQGFVPQGGVDNRFLTPHVPPVVARTIQDISGWEQLRVPAPAPPLPPKETVINQALQPPVPNQPNKQSNWSHPQVWAGVGRPPLNLRQMRSGHNQMHARPHTIMTHNAWLLPNHSGMGGVPQVDVDPLISTVPEPEVPQSQISWCNGSNVTPVHDNALIHPSQESGAGRNSSWQGPSIHPLDQHMRPGGREFSDLNNGRQVNPVESRSGWVLNDGARLVQPPFQGAYGLPPPPSYPAPTRQGQESNVSPVGGGVVTPFPHGRELKPHQQLWHNYVGPASRQIWRRP